MPKDDDKELIRGLFPLMTWVLDHQSNRLKALARLYRDAPEADEVEQLSKIETQEKLATLVKLEEWR